MFFKTKIYPILIACAMLLLAACRDDDLLSADGGANGSIEAGPALVFDINLSPYDSDDPSMHPLINVDHGEEWENYINPAKFRVIFCDKFGYYLFETDRRHLSVVSKDNKWTGKTNVYRVTIPQSDLYTTVGRAEGQNEAIRQALEEDGFKVAVLANWPNFVEGPRQIDPETKDEMLGSADDPTDELNFEWDPTKSKTKDNNHISYLSHCKFDNVYGVISYEEKTGDMMRPYNHLPYHPSENPDDEEGQMGVYSTWVKYAYRTQAEMAKALRQGRANPAEGMEFTYGYNDTGDPSEFSFTPYNYVRTVDSYNVYKQENVWRLWNFSGGRSCDYHHDNSASVNDYWQHRNDNILVYGLNQMTWPSSFELIDPKGDPLISTDNTGAKFKPYENGNSESGYLTIPSAVTSADVAKIRESVVNNKDLVSKFRTSAVSFKAYGEGTLRIRAKGPAGAKLMVITKEPGRDNTESVQFYTKRDKIPGTVDDWGPSYTSEDCMYDPVDRGQTFASRDANAYGQGVEYIINPNSFQYLEVYIAAVDGEVDLYEIEYMRARHLYDSGRNAVIPDYENPIPMYGIQNFDPIGEYLVPDYTFNMSDGNENIQFESSKYQHLKDKYNYKNIYMLRSVAKVELRFKKSVFKNNPPTQVMMRVMNRTARCEPMDVINPTDWIWYGNGGRNEYTGKEVYPDPGAGVFPGALAEFANIRQYYHEYPLKVNKNQSVDMNTFRNRTAWFYSFWAEEGDPQYYWKERWNWNGIQIDMPTPSVQYPRIFNTRVDRSDFCRFHHVLDSYGDDGEEYITYIMYVPEKNISDADSKGNLTASPKVQHIEVRFDKMNNEMNLDDNSHYRIYFTSYESENGKSLRAYNRDGLSNTFDTAERADGSEKDRDGFVGSNTLLNNLQPIMRNFHYVFTINSINDEQLGVNFSVCGAAKRDSFGSGFVIN